MNTTKLLASGREGKPNPRSGRFVPRLVACLLPIITLLASQSEALGVTIFGVDALNNLVRFDSATPGTIVSSVPIQGLAVGETILGIDFRPKDGTIFALGSTSRLYRIDYTSDVAAPTAIQVGSGPFAPALAGTFFGFDFNPTVDRIRVLSDADQNLRLNPNDGTVVDTAPATPGIQPDGNLAYAGGDPNNAQNPNIVGSGYTNSLNNSTTTTLYGIDSTLDILVTQNPPNAGVLNTTGPLGVNVGDNVGFDIDITTGVNVGYLAATVGALEQLYTIDLGTGAAILVGTVGTGTPLQGIAVAPTAFTATLIGTTATFNGDAAANSIVFDQSGGLLRHNRFTAGDSGFNSDFDFDPSTPGDQTLSATDPAVSIIVNAGGDDDQIIIGSASAPASGLAAAFQINGQGGGDTLTINDTTDTTGRNIAVDGGTSIISGLGSGPITYGTLETVNVNAGSGPDTINLTGTTAALTNINAGDGADIIFFADGASLSGGLVDGGAATDTLDYAAYTTPVTVDLSAAGAQTLFHAILTGSQEPGPLSSSPASGRLIGLLNADQSALTFNISYQGLTGAPISGTHFHNQVFGVNGPIVRGLFPSEQNGLVTPSGTFQGVWSNSDPTLTPPDPAAPGAPVRPLNAPSPVTSGSTLVQELLANRIYFNIHTLPNFPSGEIRGQLLSQGTVGPATGTGGVRNFEDITGGTNNDVLTGSAGINVIHGGAGEDLLVGGPGGDSVFGDGNNDTLVWNNGDGSDFMEGGADNDTVQVNGSPAGADQFLIQVNPADNTRLRFDRTNLGLFNLNIGTVEALQFNTLGGDDTTTVDFAGGNPIPVNGLDYDGGTESDRLVVQRSAGNYLAPAMTHNATGPGAGSIFVNGQGGSINYTGLEPVDDILPATTYTFNLPAASSQVHMIDGPSVLGFATLQINDAGTGLFELLNVARKANLIINAGTGDQSIIIENTTPPADLTNLTLNTGAGDDEIDVNALGNGIATHLNLLSGGDFVRVLGAGLGSGATLQLDGSTGFDQLVYDTGGGAVSTAAGPGAGQTTVTRDGSGTVVYQSFEDVNFINGPGGAQPLNISTRMPVQTGENVLIAGFIIKGTGAKKVIVRAIGPTLANSGISDPLADPTMELYASDGSLVAGNDNWRDSQETEIQNSGVAPQNDLESAIVATLAPGGYTVVVKGKNNTTGTGVVEGYDLDPGAPSQFANISTRGFVQTGDNVMIGGFILGNQSGNTEIALRGLGPSLSQSGVSNVLSDPTIDLHDSNGTRLGFNDNWQDNPAQAVQLSANGLAPSNPDESGIFTTLAPGAYTVILAGKDGGTGVGLVEIYDLQ